MSNAQSPRAGLTRNTIGVLLLLALGLSTLWVLRPFLPATIWATMVVITLWPVVPRLQRFFRGSRFLAAAALTLCLLLVIVVPLVVAIFAIVNNVGEITERAPETISHLLHHQPEWVRAIPFVGEKISAKWQEIAGAEREDLVNSIAPYVGEILRWVISQVGGIGIFLLHLTLTLVLSLILLLHGESAARGVRAFAHRLAGDRGDHATVLAAQSVRAVALGVIGTALIQSVLAGIGLAIAGVPYVMVLSSLVLLLGVVQVGAMPVMAGALIWVYYSKSTFALIMLGIWTLVVLGTDNVIRPILIKRGVDLPLLLIFGGVIGGIISFGIIGLFIGPVLLAVSYTLLCAWVGDGHTLPEVSDRLEPAQ